MFGFVSRITSSIQSPKALLAHSLANALSAFFDVDPTTIETSLLQDARIVLHEIQLKPQLHENARLVGSVNEISFSWQWGGNEQTSVIRETCLEIRGARFRLLVNETKQGDAATASPDKASYRQDEAAPVAAEPKDLTRMQRIVQQVVDHLTLVITDMELSIESPANSNNMVVLEATNLQLLSFGRKEEASLSQRISLDSFQAYITNDSSTMPLLDPIGYAASVERVSGRRFIDGLTRGLEVVGELNAEHGGIVLHAGTTQLHVLSQLAELLLPSDTRDTVAESRSKFPENVAENNQEENDDTTLLSQDEVFQDARDTLDDDSMHSDQPTVSPSTTFELPLPSVTILFPNESRISMPNCTFSYTADGSVCRLRGLQGIQINNNVPLIEFRNGASWLFDFTENKIKFQHGHDDGAMANVLWKENEMKQLWRGFREVLESTASVAQRLEDALEETNQLESDDTLQPWSIVVEKSISLQMQGKDGGWIEATIGSTLAILRKDILGSEVKISGVTLGPTSFGNASTQIPAITLPSDGQCFFVAEPIEAFLESAEVAENVQAFFTQILDLDSPNEASAETPIQISFSVHVSRTILTVTEPEMRIVADDVRLCNSTVHCESVQWKEAGGMSASVCGVVVLFDPNPTVNLQQVKSVHIPGVLDLITPVHDTTLAFADGKLHLQAKSVHVSPAPIETNVPATSSRERGAPLPFPIVLALNDLTLSSREKVGDSVKLCSIDMTASPTGGDAIVIESRNRIAIRVMSDTEWLDSTLGPISAVLTSSASGGYSPSSVKCCGIQLGPSSFGTISVGIPLISATNPTDTVEIGGAVDIFVQSSAMLTQLQVLCQPVSFGLLGNALPASSGTHSGSDFFPFSICIPETRIVLNEPAIKIQVKEISMHGSTVQCQSIDCSEASGISGSVSDVSVSLLKTSVHASAKRIKSLRVPGKALLAEPTPGPTLVYADGILQIRVPSLDVITPLIGTSHPGETLSTNANCEQTEFALPCPVNIDIQEFKLRSSTDMNCSILIHPLDVAIVSEDRALSIDISGPVSVQVASSSDGYLGMVVGSSSVVVLPSEIGYSIVSMNSTGIRIEPSPGLQISASVPTVSMADRSDTIKVGGIINAWVQSFGDIERVQALCHCYLSPDTSNEAPKFPWIVMPEIKFSIADHCAHLVAENVQVKENDVSCERIVANNDNGMSAVFSGLLATVKPDATIGIEWVESLYVPGVCSLQKPVQCTTLAFIGETLCVNVGTVSIISLAGGKESVKVQRSKGARPPSNAMTVPFPIRVTFNEVIMDFPVANVGEATFLRQIVLNIKATEPDPFSATKSPQGMTLSAAADGVENKMMKLDAICVSGTIYNGDTSAVHQLAFATKSAVIVAGFSSVDWSNMFGDVEEKKAPMRLPFASIKPFTAHLAYEGKVVASRTTVEVPLFEGSAKTTSGDLIQHLTNAILSKAPSIITNSEILGENVLEMSTKSGGRMLMASTMAGSAVGSVSGLVAADSIRGAVASGKKSRNASADDRYHFGDFSRGVVRSVSQATKSGGEVRRGSSERYRVGDFTTGASRSVCKYTAENKSRLSAASGSGVGMAVGAAVLGPVGFIVGGYVGSKVGGSVFEDDKVKSTEEREGAGGVASEPKHDHVMKQRNQSPTAPIGGDGLNAPIACEQPKVGTSQGAAWETRPNANFYPAAASVPATGYQPPVTTTAVTGTYNPTNTKPSAPIREADLLGLGGSYETTCPPQPIHAPSAARSHPLAARDAPPATAASVYPRPASVPHRTVPTSHHQAASMPVAAVGHAPGTLAQNPSKQPGQNKGYHFGDLTRSVVARGKRRDGRDESEGYKFGDFTRGLFG